MLLPQSSLNFVRSARFRKFTNEFPNAVDVIVRGVKAGLPLVDCLRVISQEAQEPVASEFREIVEDQTLGMPLSDAVNRLPERIPLAEANFFAIVVIIQSKSGGSLSEALSNLSKVLRDRKKMGHKIRSMTPRTSSPHIVSLPVSSLCGLVHQPGLHCVAVYDAGGEHRARVFPHVDVHGHHGDAQDDQFRLLRRARGP